MKNEFSEPSATTNVLFIERFPLLYFALDSVIKDKFPSFRTFVSSSDDALKEGGDFSCDIIVVGIIHEDDFEQNIRFLKKITRVSPKSKILFCEIGTPVYNHVPDYIREGLFGYVSFTSSLTELINCFNNLNAGIRYVNPEVLTWFVTKNKTQRVVPSHQVIPVGKPLLTERELDIAEQLLSGKRVSLIASESNRGISTISTIKKNILRKTNTNNLMELRSLMQSK